MELDRRTAVTRAGAVALGALAGCTGGGGSATPTETFEGPVVEVGPGGQYTFEPGTDHALTVSAGTTVTWVWKSGGHNIDVGSQPNGANWDGHDAIEDAGFTYQHTFDVQGTYHYWCDPHKSLGMVADLVVQ